jgi:hypothetical protein
MKGKFLRSAYLATLAAVLAVSGCSTEPAPVTKWSKPGASFDMFAADRAQCVKAARTDANGFYLAGAGYPGRGSGIGRFFGDIESEFDISDPELNRGISQEMFARCMSGHGYHADLNGFAPPAGDEVPMEF